MGSARLIKNYGFLSLGEALTKVCTFLAFAFLSRRLGPAVYGELEFSLSATLVLALFVQMGLGAYGARELARAPGRARELLAEITGLRLVVALVACALLCAFAFAVQKGPEVRLLLLAYASSLLVTPAMLLWFFQGHDAMQWVAVANLLRHGTFAACVFVFFRGERPLWWIGLFEAASITLAAAVAWGIAARGMNIRPPLPSLRPSTLWRHLRAAAPIGLADLAWALMWLAPMVALGLRIGGEELGWFGAAHRVTMALHTFVWWYFFNLLPSVARSVSEPPHELERLIQRSLGLVCWVSLFVALAGALAARPAMTIAFGAPFSGGGASLAVLIWAIPVAALSGHFRSILIGYDLQGSLLAWTAVGAAVTALGTFLLAPVYGPAAAAASLIAGNLACFALSYRTAAIQVRRIRVLNRLAPPLLAAAAACALAWTPLAADPYVLTAAACALYACLFAWNKRARLPAWRRSLANRIS